MSAPASSRGITVPLGSNLDSCPFFILLYPSSVYLNLYLPVFDKVVASIPFSLSSPITYKLLLHNVGLAVLLYQKEFAEKMVAPHGSKLYGWLSVIAQALADVENLEFVTEAFEHRRKKMRNIFNYISSPNI
ncbi:MAG: hypothetical protein ISS94_03395 [Candidatus Syntrophoarchaeum sp.]|nr:hypothetical protein [Candidatus Syntrophoarchaeum sp.]